MKNNVEGYSNAFYSLVGLSLGGVIMGSYLTVSSFFYSQKENEVKSSLVQHNPVFTSLFELTLKQLKARILINPNELTEDTLIKIIEIIKEYADHLFEKRNNENINERRKILYNLKKLKNISEKSNESEVLHKKYQEACGREYYDLYNFSLTHARSYICKKIKLNKKVLYESWEKFSQQNEIYYKINYFSNMFNSFAFDDKEYNIDLIKQLFENYSHLLISEVAKLENELSNANITNEERDELYSNRLQLIKLKISDDMYIQYNLDDRLLKFIAINKYQLLQINEKKYKNLLEKINGIDLISIGL